MDIARFSGNQINLQCAQQKIQQYGEGVFHKGLPGTSVAYSFPTFSQSGIETLNNLSARYRFLNVREVGIEVWGLRGGQCVTSIVLLTNPPVIHSVVPYGQSNKKFHRLTHYADQVPLYTAERICKVAWTRQQLDGRIESQTRLEYEPLAASQWVQHYRVPFATIAF